MLKAGDKAPEFSIPDEDGGAVSLSDLLSDGPLVLYFYPADFTPGCTREACEIRDMHDEVLDAGVRVVGISPQNGASHARFKAKYGLQFTLLADEHKTVVKAFGVDGPLGIGVRRVTYLIGRDGVIQDMVLADVRVSKHGDFIRRAVASAGR